MPRRAPQRASIRASHAPRTPGTRPDATTTCLILNSGKRANKPNDDRSTLWAKTTLGSRSAAAFTRKRKCREYGDVVSRANARIRRDAQDHHLYGSMTWSALIPGLREVRGALVAGYLWLLAIWLCFADGLHGDQGKPGFQRLWEAGEAIGPVGRAAAASVAAYLIGALVQGALRSTVNVIRVRKRLWSMRRHRGLGAERNADDQPWVSISKIVERPSEDFHRGLEVRGSSGSLSPLANLEEAELSEARDGVRGAVRHGLTVSGGEAKMKVLGRRNRALLVGLPRPDNDLVELTLPRFSAYLDIWLRRPLLETRLREVVPLTAAKIERLDYEAEFREYLVPPLIAIILILAVQASLLWLGLLVVPAALFWQAHVLRETAGGELVDALRARSGTPDLEKVTPVFQVYRAEAKRLEEALIHANWKNLRFLEEQIDHELERRG